jgi:CheY-like chemotaxis protein
VIGRSFARRKKIERVKMHSRVALGQDTVAAPHNILYLPLEAFCDKSFYAPRRFAGQAEPAVRSDLGPHMPSTVAIVDDHLAIAQAFSGLLDMLGYRCTHFESAEDFLRRGLDNDFDCLILDVVLPGMSGLDLQTTLHGLGNKTPIIFLSSHVTPALREMVMARGAREFLQKPCDIEEIDQNLRRVISGSK